MPRAQGLGRIAEGHGFNLQETFHLYGQLRQHGFKHGAQQAESFYASGAHALQARIHVGFFSQLPRFVGVHVFVHPVGQRHGIAQGFGVIALVKQIGDCSQSVLQLR